jgi:hypothetical protein
MPDAANWLRGRYDWERNPGERSHTTHYPPFAAHCFQCTLKSMLAIDREITFS